MPLVATNPTHGLVQRPKGSPRMWSGVQVMNRFAGPTHLSTILDLYIMIYLFSIRSSCSIDVAYLSSCGSICPSICGFGSLCLGVCVPINLLNLCALCTLMYISSLPLTLCIYPKSNPRWINLVSGASPLLAWALKSKGHARASDVDTWHSEKASLEFPHFDVLTSYSWSYFSCRGGFVQAMSIHGYIWIHHFCRILCLPRPLLNPALAKKPTVQIRTVIR